MSIGLNYFRTAKRRLHEVYHIFPTLRIVRINGGHGKWKIGQTLEDARVGDVFLLNNLTTRRIEDIIVAPFELDVFEFPPEAIYEFPNLISAFYNQKVTKFQGAKADTLNRVLLIIAETYETAKDSRFIDHQLMSVFSLLDGMCPKTLGNLDSVGLKAARLIWDDYREDISVSSISKSLNVSKSHLENVFKKVHNISVGEYLRHIRIYHVTNELKRRPDRSVLDIALSNGFKSASGFYKAFKTVTGQTPKSVI